MTNGVRRGSPLPHVPNLSRVYKHSQSCTRALAFLTVLLQLVFVFHTEYIFFFTPFNICALWMLERPSSKNNFSKLPLYIIIEFFWLPWQDFSLPADCSFFFMTLLLSGLILHTVRANIKIHKKYG